MLAIFWYFLNMIFLTLLLFHSSNIFLALLKFLVSSLCSMSSILLPVLVLLIMSLQLSFHAIGFPWFNDFGSWPPPVCVQPSSIRVRKRQCVLRTGCAHPPTAEHEGVHAAQMPVSHTLLQPHTARAQTTESQQGQGCIIREKLISQGK